MRYGSGLTEPNGWVQDALGDGPLEWDKFPPVPEESSKPTFALWDLRQERISESKWQVTQIGRWFMNNLRILNLLLSQERRFDGFTCL